MKKLTPEQEKMNDYIRNNEAIPKHLWDDGNDVIRLRRADGTYLSILPCSKNENGEMVRFDLAEPSGEVLFCGIDLELVMTLIENFGKEKI
jgi:hypothetical protein